jgi:hypothetical protein
MVGQELHWTQPDPFARTYELRAGAEILATLQWEKPWGSLAVARTATGHWTFQRDGVWHSRIAIRTADTGAECATFRSGSGGVGGLEMADGRIFHWSSANLWHVEWTWEDPARQPLLRFRSKIGLRTAEAEVSIEPAGLGHPDLPLLAALGWYLLLLTQDTTFAGGSSS